MTSVCKKVISVLIIILLLLAAVFSFAACNKIPSDKSGEIIDVPDFKNLVIIIGDGMGYAHIKAGELISGQSYPFTKWKGTDVNTDSWNIITGTADKVTDSAAAATALATGNNTKNSYVGKDINGNDLETIMDVAVRLGKSTGIVTTDKMHGATPAAFSAHTTDRSNSQEIITSQLASGVNLLCSAVTSESKSSKDAIIEAGYSYCDDYQSINSILSADYAYCQFNLGGNENNIKLSSVAHSALDFLSKDDDGFVLMIEMAHIDKFAHDKNFEGVARCSSYLNDTVNEVIDWVGSRSDTAVIVTADHETGGLMVSEDPDKYSNKAVCNSGETISYKFTSSAHSSRYVCCYVYGFDVEYSKFDVFRSQVLIKNTEIFALMKSLIS